MIDHLTLSVQTDPMMASKYFARTTLLNKSGSVISTELGYHDATDGVNHAEPEDLFTHITDILEKLKVFGPEFGLDLKTSSNENDEKHISHERHSDEKDDEHVAPDPKNAEVTIQKVNHQMMEMMKHNNFNKEYNSFY